MINRTCSAMDFVYLTIMLSVLLTFTAHANRGNTMTNMSSSHCIFKPVQYEDIPLLQSWFKQPHVIAWWPVPQEGEDVIAFLKRTRQDVVSYMVLLDSKPIGYIQSYLPSGYVNGSDEISNWLPPLPKNTLGIDQFIGDPDYMGKGFGTLLIKEFVAYLAKSHNCSCVIMDPEPINHVAIRCYEKVGFKKIGEYVSPWGPALLMRYDVE